MTTTPAAAAATTSPPDDGAAVVCRDVARTFGSGRQALVAVHGTSCHVPAHARIAIVGPSGSGKSTLLHLMAGLDTPTTGTVAWPTMDPDAHRRRLQIGVVFQSPSLVPALDVMENVRLPLVLAGVEHNEREQRTRDALDLVGLGDVSHQLPEELSGGQAQRVALARVLAQRPVLVLADEPTGQLDTVSGQRVVDALLLAVDEIGAALVVTTHDLSVADRMSETWSMHEGRLVGRIPAGLTR